MKSKEMLAKAKAMQDEYRRRVANGAPMTAAENLQRADEMMALASKLSAESARIAEVNTIIMVVFAAAAAVAVITTTAITMFS